MSKRGSINAKKLSGASWGIKSVKISDAIWKIKKLRASKMRQIASQWNELCFKFNYRSEINNKSFYKQLKKRFKENYEFRNLINKNIDNYIHYCNLSKLIYTLEDYINNEYYKCDYKKLTSTDIHQKNVKNKIKITTTNQD